MPMARPDQLGKSLERSGISENSNKTVKIASTSGQRGSTWAAESASFLFRRDRAEIFASDFTDGPPRSEERGFRQLLADARQRVLSRQCGVRT